MEKEIKNTILFASDHAGFKLKESLMEYAKELGYQTEDMGPFEYDPTDDYPKTISPLAQKISENPDKYIGIIIGWSGQGEAMSANRFPNVRACVYYGEKEEVLRLAREHNDSNVLSLASLFLSDEKAKNAMRVWLETPFSEDERHIRRIEELN